MSLQVTQRPYQNTSKWNAVGNPVLYKMQRKDLTFSQINNSSGFVQLQFNGVDLTTSFAVDDSIYVKSDNSVYDSFGSVTAESYSTNTLITTDIPYSSSAPGGFVNNDNLKPSYRVEVEVYDSEDNLLSDSAFTYSPNTKGLLTIDISSVLRNNLLPDNDSDLSAAFDDTNVYLGFYIKYREVWTDGAESQTNDSVNEFFGILGAMQIPSTYGGNILEYLIQDTMKLAEVTLSTGQILTGNSVPVDIIAAPGAGKVLVPIAVYIKYKYNSIAYATNVDFELQLNGLSYFVVNSMLDNSANSWIVQKAQDTGVITTDIENKALKFKVSGGDPTAGNSPLYVKVIYTIVDAE